ncbi:hypothetical protein HNR53_003891 [Bacillus benzoevorans]|uniref:Uncharacterized protein n=1 Tax=Bacillus benzoevorans TaxID=1456 RepID=A0A7X0HWI1_9BACI|nr:hypothetical protein [Bacillus benzoevorans]
MTQSRHRRIKIPQTAKKPAVGGRQFQNGDGLEEVIDSF